MSISYTLTFHFLIFVLHLYFCSLNLIHPLIRNQLKRRPCWFSLTNAHKKTPQKTSVGLVNKIKFKKKVYILKIIQRFLVQFFFFKNIRAHKSLLYIEATKLSLVSVWFYMLQSQIFLTETRVLIYQNQNSSPRPASSCRHLKNLLETSQKAEWVGFTVDLLHMLLFLFQTSFSSFNSKFLVSCNKLLHSSIRWPGRQDLSSPSLPFTEHPQCCFVLPGDVCRHKITACL